jgi:hypothetical protein
MADKFTQRTVGIKINRLKRYDAKVVRAVGFKLRPDDEMGLIEVQIAQKGLKAERILFDPLLLKGNTESLEQYVGSIPETEDDASLKEEIAPLSDTEIYSNIVHLSFSGDRAETVFALFRWYDWVEATAPKSSREVDSADALVLVSTKSFQKKLALELLAAIDDNS